MNNLASTTIDELRCRELVALVTDYLEDALPEAERARFERHLAQCTGCQRYLTQIRQTIALTGKLREVDIDPESRTTLLAAFNEWQR